MKTRMRVAAVAAALATAVSGTALLPAPGDAAAPPPTIRATVTKNAIRLSSHHVTAGLVKFRVTTPSGAHTLQLFRLHTWYSLQKFQRDINLAFQGKVHAIQRVDRGVVFAGGAEAKKKHPGRFAQELRAGTYYVLDQNGSALTRLTVTARTQPRGGITAASHITGTGKDRFRAPRVIPHTGWTRFSDVSPDEPHFLVFQHVKRGTTRAQVTKFIKAGAQGQPPWALRENTSSGVIAPGTHTLFHYNLPAGRYVILCFWPSDETGMPHAFMGMYRMINLR